MKVVLFSIVSVLLSSCAVHERPPVEGERVSFSSTLLAIDQPFEMEAQSIELWSNGLRAQAQRLRSTEDGLELEGEVSIEGSIDGRSRWSIEARYVHFPRLAMTEQGVAISAMTARGDVRLAMPMHDLAATGDELHAGSIGGVIRLTGAPVRIVTPLATTEADWVEFDADLGLALRTGQARITPTEG